MAHELERVCGAREILSVAIFWKVNMCAHFAGCAVPRGAAGTAGWAGLVFKCGRRRLGLQAGHDFASSCIACGVCCMSAGAAHNSTFVKGTGGAVKTPAAAQCNQSSHRSVLVCCDVPAMLAGATWPQTIPLTCSRCSGQSRSRAPRPPSRDRAPCSWESPLSP